jgi:hypothetical protein
MLITDMTTELILGATDCGKLVRRNLHGKILYRKIGLNIVSSSDFAINIETF